MLHYGKLVSDGLMASAPCNQWLGALRSCSHEMCAPNYQASLPVPAHKGKKVQMKHICMDPSYNIRQ